VVNAERYLTDDGRLLGGVTFENLAEIRATGEELIRASGENTVEFDCSGLVEASSVAVALLIAWRRAARNCGKAVVFNGASLGLRNIVAFSGLSDILLLADQHIASSR